MNTIHPHLWRWSWSILPISMMKMMTGRLMPWRDGKRCHGFLQVAQLHHLFVDLNRRLAQGAGSRMFLEIPKNPSGKQFTLHTRIVMTLFVKGSWHIPVDDLWSYVISTIAGWFSSFQLRPAASFGGQEAPCAQAASGSWECGCCRPSLDQNREPVSASAGFPLLFVCQSHAFVCGMASINLWHHQ